MINKDEILRGYLKRMGGVWVVAVQMIQPACYEPGAKDMQGGIAPKSFPYFTLCAQNYINVALALLLKAKG